MGKISTKFKSSLIFVIILITTGYIAGADWPLKTDIDLSSGFGDLRNFRFHAGIDLRTGGVEGREVFSPVDGYVWRIKMSYYGYGKGLYIKGDDGYLYVFGHLKDFTDKIDNVVKKRQVADTRYYLDMTFPVDSLRVKKGELVAFSGQTGSGAPHLHFEKRSGDNYPVNPLTHGYRLKDNTRPVFTRIGFQLADDHSVFYGGTRKIYLDVSPTKKDGYFYLDTILYFNSPFGIFAECFDRIRPGGMRQAVYKLTLQVDGKTCYQVIFDSLDFDKGGMVNLEYDYQEAISDKKQVRRLFSLPGNEYNGSRVFNDYRGLIGYQAEMKVGLHEGKITAEDCFGNISELHFKFLWGPPTDIFHLDSVQTAEDSSYHFYFSPTPDYKALDIDTVYVLRNWAKNWLNDSLNYVYKIKPDYLIIKSKRRDIERNSLKLVMITRQGSYIEDKPFNGIVKGYCKNLDIVYEPLDDGLLITAATPGNFLGDIFLRIYRGDSVIDEKYPALYKSAEQYIFFLPPDNKYLVIDSLAIALNFDDGSVYNRFVKKVNICLAGINPVDNIRVDSIFTIQLKKNSFYLPQFITWEKKDAPYKITHFLNSDYYSIFPEAIMTKENISVSIKLDEADRNNNFDGLCWLDNKNNKWFWLENTLQPDGYLTAGSIGGGTFALVSDFVPPRVEQLSLKHGSLITDRQPLISFILEDTLSGFADDRSINITLDNRWLIPEYNPQTKICQTRPLEPLSLDKHTLKIVAIDRAGNKVEQNVQFRVISSR